MNSDENGHEALWWNPFSWSNETKMIVGGAFIALGLIATAVTGGAFLPALAATAKAVAISTAVSAGIGAAAGGISTQSWSGAFKGMIDGAVDGFMWGGIFAGTAQIASAGFKTAAKLGATTGRKGGIQLFKNVKVLSPNNVDFFENGGTLIRIGKNLCLDVGSKTLLHAHALGFNHIPVGTAISSYLGGIDALF